MFGVNLIEIMGIVQGAVFPYIGSTCLVGGSILAFLLLLELLSEALDLSTGRGFKLDKRLVMLLFCAAFITLYPQLANGIWTSAMNTAAGCTSELAKIGKMYEESMRNIMQTKMMDNALSQMPGGAIISLFKIGDSIGFSIAQIIMMLSNILLFIMVIGAFAALGIVIIVGPIFIAFLMNSATRGIFLSWVRCVLSYFIMIPMMHWALAISAKIYFSAAGMQMTAQGGVGFSHILALTIGPLVGLGIILHVPKIVAALIGGSGGSGSEMVGAVAAAGMTAMYASRGSAGGAARAASGAVGGGGAVNSSPHIKASRS